VLLVSILALLMGGCGTQPAAQDENEPVKFKIGHCTWVGYGPLYIAGKAFFASTTSSRRW
jgi:hypothetical protein